MCGHLITAPNTSVAWLQAIEYLLQVGGQCSNLQVCIEQPLITDPGIHQSYEQLLTYHGLRTLKQVTYTIFPRSLYLEVERDPVSLFDRYNRPGGVYERLRRRHRGRFGWGSYFRRMTCFPTTDGVGNLITINQLGNLIQMLQDRVYVHRSAYTIFISVPGEDARRTRGGPCLNYIALQLQTTKILNILAVYRNHDFIQRAYGNYLGLAYLMEFLCDQTEYKMGMLTCLSSHATIANVGGVGSWPGKHELRSVTSSVTA